MMLNAARLTATTGLALYILILATIACSQERERVIDLTMDEKTPPSFSVSGNSLAVDFLVEEVRRTKPPNKGDSYAIKGETIWKISAPSRIDAASWPLVTYGEVPMGLSQVVPEHGAPPKLAEGKVYSAHFLDGSVAESYMYFEVRNGKTVNCTDEFIKALIDQDCKKFAVVCA